MPIDLQKPTTKFVEKYVLKFKEDQRYFPADRAITKLFSTFPDNILLENILLKISVLNDLYSTNIFATFILAQHILSLNLDQKLIIGDPDAVNSIATGHGIISSKTGVEITFYSFATKYCNWHNQESYVIYDSYVEKILMAYQRRDKFSCFRKADLKNFPTFKKIITDFIENYNLHSFSLKEIDKFLWIYGKEKFPAKKNTIKINKDQMEIYHME